jgi:hypothetical protein
MRSTPAVVTLALFCCLVIGCGADDTTVVSEATVTPNAATTEGSAPSFKPVRSKVEYEDPRDTVTEFLASVRAGDDATATSLLTTAAQQEAWKNGLAISADGFPDAEFQVAEVEYLRDNTEAHVKSTWSDITPTGESQSFECVWLLNREPHGWCVYGMATKFLDHVPPVILNFENQREMMKKQQWAAELISRHRQQQVADGSRGPVQQAMRNSTQSTR